MIGFLFLAFIVVPVLEIYIITQVAGQLGWLETIFLVIAVSAAGAWLVKREGIGVIRRVQLSLGRGKIPAKELADGAMIFFASALMLTPGFLTDAVGLGLLFPPIRALLRPSVVSYFKKRTQIRAAGMGPGFGTGFGERPRTGDVYDVDGTPSAEADVTDISDDPPELL